MSDWRKDLMWRFPWSEIMECEPADRPLRIAAATAAGLLTRVESDISGVMKVEYRLTTEGRKALSH